MTDSAIVPTKGGEGGGGGGGERRNGVIGKKGGRGLADGPRGGGVGGHGVCV